MLLYLKLITVAIIAALIITYVTNLLVNKGLKSVAMWWEIVSCIAVIYLLAYLF